MQMIKSFFGLVILAAIAALVYVGLNNSRMIPDAPEVLKEWQKPFEVKTAGQETPESSGGSSEVTGVDPAELQPPEVELIAPPPSRVPRTEVASQELMPVRRPDGLLTPPAALMEAPVEENGANGSRLQPPQNARPADPGIPGGDVVQTSAVGAVAEGAIPAEVDQLLREGKLSEALLGLTRARYGTGTPTVESQGIDTLLNQLAGSVIYSEESYLEPPYSVQPGDTWENLAGRYGITSTFLARINKLDESQPLSVGQSLKVVHGPFDGTVSLGRRELILTVNGRYAGRFPIAVGDDARGASGSYIVQSKTRNPTYHDGNRAYPPGDPGNPLGECLINLDQGIGLHGTASPAALSGDGGPGWFRLSNQDINDLDTIFSVGSRIVIEP